MVFYRFSCIYIMYLLTFIITSSLCIDIITVFVILSLKLTEQSPICVKLAIHIFVNHIYLGLNLWLLTLIAGMLSTRLRSLGDIICHSRAAMNDGAHSSSSRWRWAAHAAALQDSSNDELSISHGSRHTYTSSSRVHGWFRHCDSFSPSAISVTTAVHSRWRMHGQPYINIFVSHGRL